MKFTTLDAIARSVLQQRQLPIHYYLQYLKHIVDCFRERHFDTLRVVHAKKLTVTDYGVAEIPCDCVDIIKVGIAAGQMVRPLHKNDGISRIYELDELGKPTSYPTVDDGSEYTPTGTMHTNDRDENIGRLYGFYNGLLEDTYRILPEKGVIQLNQNLGLTEIIIEYISDGTYCDAATMVDPLAQKTLEDYAKWQVSPGADNPRSPQALKFFQSWRELKARKNPLTKADIIRIVNSAKTPTIR